MKSNSKKVILDTNLWISFLITKNYEFLELKQFESTEIITMSDFLQN